MTEITSGTVNATPLGDFWIGTIEVTAGSGTDGNTINLATLIGTKIKEVVYAEAVRNSSQSGSVDISPVSWTSGTAKITLGNSGTQSGTRSGTATSIDGGRTTLENYRRDIFFVAKSQQ